MVKPWEKAWEPVDVDLDLADIENYSATSDWLQFDCVCMDKTEPEWLNKPYDFNLQSLADQHYTCERCGRQYRVKVKVEVEVYTPIAIKYPDAKYPAELGLRDKED